MSLQLAGPGLSCLCPRSEDRPCQQPARLFHFIFISSQSTSALPSPVRRVGGRRCRGARGEATRVARAQALLDTDSEAAPCSCFPSKPNPGWEDAPACLNGNQGARRESVRKRHPLKKAGEKNLILLPLAPRGMLSSAHPSPGNLQGEPWAWIRDLRPMCGLQPQELHSVAIAGDMQLPLLWC